MLNNIRNFSKTIFAKILMVIIIVPFIFWGMGGVFSGGNSNSIVKINKQHISTQDFIDYLNNSKLDNQIIRENLDNNILEELLSKLVSETLLEMEIKKLKIHISEETLANIIKNDKNFLDENNKFTRIKYEKFLLTHNLTATFFEEQLKKNELKKKLFSYISGGIKSPDFMVKNIYLEQTKKLNLDYINLQDNYKKKEKFTISEINLFIQENKETLIEETLNFSYIKLSPLELIGLNEFTEEFFQKIDEIENKILNNVSFFEISKELQILPIKRTNYKDTDKNKSLEEKIYKKRNEEKMQIIEDDNFYILYNIDKINKSLPSLKNNKFKEKVLNYLFEKEKFEYNKNLMTKINEKKFTNSNFIEISNNNLKNIQIESISDISKFTKDSINLLYNLPINAFALIVDIKDNVYLSKVISISEKNITNTNNEFEKYKNQSNINLRNFMYSSYDNLLNKKYKVTINQNTLERVKNYFR